MPKAINYKANSVIYFTSDVADRVFLLKSGNIALTYIDIETDTQVTDYIKTGEFFGVKSVLGNYPREESAIVLTDSVVYAFTGHEFEAFASGNPRIILQMIKVFSKQLRKVHAQIKSLTEEISGTSSEDNPQLAVSNDDGLFSVAQAFFNSKHYRACAAVCERYVSLYRTGQHIPEIKRFLVDCQSNEGLNFGAAEHEVQPTVIETPDVSRPKEENSDSELFARAQAAERSGNTDAAYSQYHDLLDSEDADLAQAAALGAGRCLLHETDYVGAIQLLSGAITKNPRSSHVPEMLFYIGLSYQQSGKAEKAAAFYDRALSMTSDEKLSAKIQAKKASLQGEPHA